ncbi:MAG TPA: hypothetical protein DCM86_12010 [Verrucomicrobiales bacterium]|nr:hypothetical protein [Verrucomicrobiales bacterium]
MKSTPVNTQAIFTLAFEIEQTLGPETYRTILQGLNVLLVVNDSGSFVSAPELKTRAACVAWLAGLHHGKSLEQVLGGIGE